VDGCAGLPVGMNSQETYGWRFVGSVSGARRWSSNSRVVACIYVEALD
jgi:hypothetical protein